MGQKVMSRFLLLLTFGLIALGGKSQNAFFWSHRQRCAYTAPVMRDGGLTSSGSGTTIDIYTPGGTEAGDLLIAFVALATKGAEVTVPSGWVTIYSYPSASYPNFCLFYKLATEAGTTTTSVTVSSSGEKTAGAVAVAMGHGAPYFTNTSGVYSLQAYSSVSSASPYFYPSYCNSLLLYLAVTDVGGGAISILNTTLISAAHTSSYAYSLSYTIREVTDRVDDVSFSFAGTGAVSCYILEILPDNM